MGWQDMGGCVGLGPWGRGWAGCGMRVRENWGVTWGWGSPHGAAHAGGDFHSLGFQSHVCRSVPGSRDDAKAARGVRTHRDGLWAALGCLLQECCPASVPESCANPLHRWLLGQQILPAHIIFLHGLGVAIELGNT